VTPRWLLRSETTAFSLSAIFGLAALISIRASGGAGARVLTTSARGAGVVAVAMHGVRLSVYLKARGTKSA
jgi:hypothetical protein